MESAREKRASEQVDAEKIRDTFRELGLSEAHDRARFSFVESHRQAWNFQVVISNTSSPQFR
jgi:hypothetical protein